MSLKGILRTPYALSQSPCQQSNREELFPRCAVSQAHGDACTGATQAPWADPAVGRAGIKQEQTPHRANPPESLLTESITAELSNSTKKAKAHIHALSTLTGREEPPSSAFLLDRGFLHQAAKFSKLLAENTANQNKHKMPSTQSHRTEGWARKVLPQSFTTECDCSPTPSGKT